MKKIITFLVVSIMLVSCTDEQDFTNKTFEFTNLAADEYNFTVNLGDTGNFNIPVINSIPAPSAKTFSVTVDEDNSSYTAGSYTIPNSITIAENENVANVEIIADDTIDSNGENITLIIDGDSISEPFTVSVNMALFCPVVAPQEGTWKVRTKDAFGDTWGPAEVVVSIDGVANSFTSARGENDFTDKDLIVAPGVSEITVVFNGNGERWTNEVSYQVVNPNGDIILDVSYSTQRIDTIDETLNLNYCLF